MGMEGWSVCVPIEIVSMRLAVKLAAYTTPLDWSKAISDIKPGIGTTVPKVAADALPSEVRNKADARNVALMAFRPRGPGTTLLMVSMFWSLGLWLRLRGASGGRVTPHKGQMEHQTFWKAQFFNFSYLRRPYCGDLYTTVY